MYYNPTLQNVFPGTDPTETTCFESDFEDIQAVQNMQRTSIAAEAESPSDGETEVSIDRSPQLAPPPQRSSTPAKPRIVDEGSSSGILRGNYLVYIIFEYM